VTPRDLELAASLCADRAGLNVDPDKHYLLENRLAPVARREGFSSIEELMAAVRNRGEERMVWAVVEAMWPAETSFFRDPATFELIASDVLPKLARRADKAPLRIWSANCGAGQEVYSLAMLLSEQTSFGASVELFASDLCERRLEKAQSGLYSQFEVQRGLPIQFLMKYFSQAGETWQIAPDIRAMVQYRPLNLLADFTHLGTFDIVFCRNVLIYFDQETKVSVLERLARISEHDGYLVLGAAETVVGLTEVFKPMMDRRGLYMPNANAKASVAGFSVLKAAAVAAMR